MRSFVFPFLWLAAPFLALSPAHAIAPDYRATTGTLVDKSLFVTRDAVWHCQEHDCSTQKSAIRPDILCALLAKRAGNLTAFAVNGDAFDAEKLERCNAHAK